MGAVFRQMVSAPDLTALVASVVMAGALNAVGPVATGTDFASRLENAAVQNGIKSGVGLAVGLTQGAAGGIGAHHRRVDVGGGVSGSGRGELYR